ncbi:cytochrome P450 [Schizophyllum commune H4-8]|uniref:Cytochrome P450 n=1 Tax=Schizophyllum commune (strain H4-8 / FGSC 9210) TaxID=578458 RepID=D8Q4U1_SCHCM|nr:cytochrome P450 [Schizophyllum commune H4-8]KAI5892471.1 cytochrome P450 [Schizophyllum commune H4-8]
MFAKAFLTFAALVIARSVWRFLQRFVVRTPLDNIPGPAPASLMTGNFKQLFSVDGWAFHERLASQYGPSVRLTGAMGERILYVADPKALYHIVVKDQDIFEEHPQFIAANSVFFGPGLLTTTGDHHRKQRKLMNPVFSTTHMRNMIPLFYEVIDALRTTLERKIETSPTEVDMLHWMGRTALELISRSGLGYSFDSLAPDAVPHPYAASVKEFIPTMFRLFLPRVYILPHVYNLGPAWFRRAVVNLIPSPTMHALRDMTDVMWNTCNDIYSQKVAALQAGDAEAAKQVGGGKDILSLLIRANQNTDDPLPKDEVLAQMSTIVFAAMDTTSSALVRILHLLSTHTDVQDRIRAEIRAAKREHGSVLAYDQLEALPYLDAVCRETLRLYPPVPQLMRMARKDVVLPFSKPVIGEDGKELSDVFLPAGTMVMIAIMNANRNKEIWGGDAGEWKPERWLAPLPETVAEAHVPGIYSHLMTFLGGGRACIGFKFSQLEMKTVLVELLDTFKVAPSAKTVHWRMSNIVSPYLEEEPQRSQCPVLLSKAD